MNAITKRAGVSNSVFGVTVAVLLIVAAVGYGLYSTASSQVTTTTSTYTSIGTTTLTSTSTVVSTSTLTTGSSTSASLGYTGGFLNGKESTFVFYTPPVCSPALTQLFPNQTAAAAKTNCEVGATGTFPTNAVPVWGMVPFFAGLSVFGIPQFGASPDGFPTYHNQTILTNCAAIGSLRSCPDHPPLFYSPAITAVEQSMGVTTGMMGLPEGVMPFPAHTHIVTTTAGQANIPWDVISVMVFDPNIFPNPVTGQCTQTVPSSLSNATANCLTSITALQNAMQTSNPDIAQANAGNPVWSAMGKPLMQVVIPGDMQPSQIANPNTNIDVPFAVIPQDPYPPYLSNATAP